MNDLQETDYFFFHIYVATITIVNIDTNEDEQLRMTSSGGATGLNLREDERMYFGGLPKAGRYRYGDVHSQTEASDVIE